MKFYVIANGYMGERYCRVYIASENDDRAKEIASAVFKKSERGHGRTNYYAITPYHRALP